MVMSAYQLVTPNERPDLLDAADEIAYRVWPQFMLDDPVADRHWGDLYRLFPDYQFGLQEVGTERLVAVGNSLPLAWDGDPDTLPAEGWDWALAQGFRDLHRGLNPRTQCALSITIDPAYQGKGISAQVVRTMKAIGSAHGLRALIAPVRPTHKARYPLTPMDRYVRWRDEAGLPLDPWMRVHVRLGAAVIKVCPASMRIAADVATWETWCAMRFPETGSYVVPGALSAVAIDRERDEGLYIEPNVWMRHPIT
jgi:GNAT superfamily N-acetyltransferase